MSFVVVARNSRLRLEDRRETKTLPREEVFRPARVLAWVVLRAPRATMKLQQLKARYVSVAWASLVYRWLLLRVYV